MGRLVAERMAAKPLMSYRAPARLGWGWRVHKGSGSAGVARCLRVPLPGLWAPSQVCGQTCRSAVGFLIPTPRAVSLSA